MIRVLVTYASKHGGTAELADVIAGALRDAGIGAELRPANEVREVAGFDAVIVGSAVYMNKWQGSALDVLKQLERHPEVKVWMFSSGPTGGSPESDEKAAEIITAQPAAPGEAGKRGAKLGARDHATFGGRITDDMGGFFERWMPRGDWRDLAAARAWSAGIGHEVREARIEGSQ